jgi:hypothetical protein
MAGETIVFFAKYSTLAGVASPGTEYFSDPYEVTSYKTCVLEAYNGGVTQSATISVQPQQSSDLITWADKGSAIAPTAGTVATVTVSDPARYLRLKVTIVGANGTVTFWAKAVARDS